MAPGWAGQLTDTQGQLNQLNNQADQTRKNLQNNKTQQQNILQELQQISSDVNKAEGDLQKLNADRTSVQGQIATTQQTLNQAQKDLQKRSDLLGQRLTDIYTDGNVSYTAVLLQSTGMSDFLTRFDLIQQVAEQDAKLMTDLAADRDQIAKNEKNLEAQKEQIVYLQTRTQSQQAFLNSRSTDRQQSMDQLQSQQTLYAKALDTEDAETARLGQMVRSLQAGGSSGPRKGTGRFIWPANGPVTSPFGMRMHPILHTMRMHYGIDIGAAYGSPVVAPDDGTVVYTGYNAAVGNEMVIDHGAGISTVYEHLSSFAVSAGSSVRQGQLIAKVGDTGTLCSGAHLHFEVHVNGTAVNPISYL